MYRTTLSDVWTLESTRFVLNPAVLRALCVSGPPFVLTEFFVVDSMRLRFTLLPFLFCFQLYTCLYLHRI